MHLRVFNLEELNSAMGQVLRDVNHVMDQVRNISLPRIPPLPTLPSLPTWQYQTTLTTVTTTSNPPTRQPPVRTPANPEGLPKEVKKPQNPPPKKRSRYDRLGDDSDDF